MADPMQDQLDAAENEATYLFQEVSKRFRAPVGVVGSVAHRVARDFEESIRRGNAKMCPHVTPGPMPLFGTACIPGFIACPECLKMLHSAHVLLDQADGKGRTCDGCGEKKLAGHSGLIQHGPLLLAVSLCDPCSKAEVA